MTGFRIPEETSKKMLEEMPDNVETMKEEVDYFCTIRNPGGKVELEGETWENFTRTFQQEVEVVKGGCCGDGKDLSNESSPAPQMVRRLASKEETRYAATSFRMRRRSFRRPFSVGVSTEENHKSDDRNFYGKYSHIRETLDYDYHCNYTYDRQKFQDAIITEFLHGAVITDKDGQICTTPTEPWLVFTAGAVSLFGRYSEREVSLQTLMLPLLSLLSLYEDGRWEIIHNEKTCRKRPISSHRIHNSRSRPN